MDQWRLGGFTEVRELGIGGQGRVVLARHEESGAPVAIKYLLVDDEHAVERMRREAVLLSRVSDPHVVRLYRFVRGEQGAAIVMEAVDGVSLRKILERYARLAPEAALLVLKGSLLGLEAAHAVGVAHRDYKPANVVVRADGLSKLIDFGIAGLFGSAARGGSAFYMAPEQWEGSPASAATDVYAATCVFFECVTGRRPYEAQHRAALMNSHLNAPVPVEAVPEALRPLVARGMAKDPGQRPPGAGAFTTELEAAAVAAFGEDWERRGLRALATAAAALAALFPLAALSAGSAGTAAGTTAASGGVLSGTTGKVTLAVAGTALAVATGTAATLAVQRAGDADPAASTTTPQAALVALQQCRYGPDSGAPPGTSRIRLPTQVRLPAGAAVYEVPYGTPRPRFIGPAGRPCAGDGGSGTGNAYIGDPEGEGVRLVIYYRAYQCRFFPSSPAAAELRRTDPDNCGSAGTFDNKQDIPLGIAGHQAFLSTSGAPGSRPRTGELAVILATLTPGDRDPTGLRPAQPMIACHLRRDRADTCTAALTYHLVQQLTGTGAPRAVIDRAARQIQDYVNAQRR